VTDYWASAAVLFCVFGSLVSEQVEPCVTMFEVELCLAIDISIDIIAVTLYFPVVSTISIALIPEGRHLLSPGYRTLEARMRVQILLGVHVLEPYFSAAP